MLPEKQKIVPIPLYPAKGNAIWWLAVAAALVSALLLPRHSDFEYRYALDRVWLYNDLSAPFDFLMAEKPENRQENAITPYYLLDPSVVHQQKLQLSSIFQNQKKVSKQDAEFDDFNANFGTYKAFATTLLDGVYRRGIIEEKPDNPAAIVVIGQSSLQIAAQSTLTVAEAMEVLTDSLPFSTLRQPELLLPMLEKVLVPNVFYSDSLTALLGNSNDSIVGVVKKGTLIVQKGERVDESILIQLDSLQRAYGNSNEWGIRAGYALFALIAFGSLFTWFYFFEAQLFAQHKQLTLIVLLILALIGLVLVCHYAGPAVPLLLPFYLLPLILQSQYSLNASVIIWSLPVMLVGFALDWGMLWVCIQAAGAGVSLILNHWVGSWRDRILALFVIFSVQSLVWYAALLAGKAPETMQNSDILVFLALAAILSISRAVLMRFFKAIHE